MLVNQRIMVIKEDASIQDASLVLNNLNFGMYDFEMTDSEYMYIGSDLPFNHRFFYIETANITPANLAVDIWDGNNWNAAVDVNDQTAIASTDAVNAVRAKILNGRILFTAVDPGVGGNDITISLVTVDALGDTAVVYSVIGKDIVIHIEDNVTQFSTLLTALNASAAVKALVTFEVQSGYDFENDFVRDNFADVGALHLAGGVDGNSNFLPIPFAQHGIISWATDRYQSWGIAATTEDVPALANGPKIYDFYWARIKVSADLHSGTQLKYVGHKFSSDYDFDNLYPDLNLTTTKTAFTTGKTNWQDQHILAAEEVIRYIRQKGYVQSRSQIMDWEQFNLAATHMCAKMIYSSFGTDYEDRKKTANEDFHRAMNMGIVQVDRNRTGKLEPQEKSRQSGLFRR